MNSKIRQAISLQGLIVALTVTSTCSAPALEQTHEKKTAPPALEQTHQKKVAPPAPQQEKTQSGSAAQTSPALKVELIETGTLDQQSQEVIDTLQTLLLGLAHRNVEQVAACLSEDVTAFDDRGRKSIYGKQAVLDNLKKNVMGEANIHPVSRIAIYNPFVRVKGDSAMVSYRATKDMPGSKPSKVESWCSQVFERKDGKWLVLWFRSNWQPVASK